MGLSDTLESIMADGQVDDVYDLWETYFILTAQKMCVMYMMRVWQSQVRFFSYSIGYYQI